MTFTNGLGARGIGMPAAEFRRAMTNHAARTEKRLAAGDQYASHPSQLGMSMVLEARGNVYGDVRSVPGPVVDKRRARNKAAAAARRTHRKAARR